MLRKLFPSKKKAATFGLGLLALRSMKDKRRGERRTTLINFALLVLRTTIGGLMAGHGAQKLFGWFGGYGLQGTAQWLESLDLRPGRSWAMAAGTTEFGGGLLIVLGLLNPLGPVSVMSSMMMAARKVHWGKPIWVTEGGAELPVTNMAIATALMVAGPGKYSLDRLLGTSLPRWVAIPALATSISVIAYATTISERAEQREREQMIGETQQSETGQTV
ncbi:MAG: hypothetical protein KatS3mg057_2541 [Herpetosiphonaceae bacterium]|nr:MAG: hypothetical protein KatS3mg057_2541 [Herpetosiphonaceae bacterium]